VIKKSSVYIIILNWNQKDLTLECLRSLEKVIYTNYKIILVDNGSVDGSVQQIQTEYPNLCILKNKDNLGFSGGNNVGIQYALDNKCDYIYLLNNDTEVEPSFLDEVVNVLDNDQSIGIAGSTVFYFEPSDIVWYAGGHANWISGDMLDPRVGKKIDLENCKIEDVDEVAGAGMLVRKEALKEVGLLNEDFFIYFEETDLCQRIKKNGQRVVWAPKSLVWHKVSSSFGEESPVMIYLMTRNRWLFMRTHSPRFKTFILHYFLRTTRDFIRYIFQSKFKLGLAIVFGIRDVILSRYGKGELDRLR